MPQSTLGTVPREVVRTACMAVCGAQVLLALVLVGRSLAGALTRELSPLAACVVATAALAAGLGAYLLSRWTWAESLRERWLSIAAAFGPPLLVVLVVLPTASVGAVAYATVLVVLCTGAAWLAEHEPPCAPQATVSLQSGVARDRSADGERPGVVQWMSRSEEGGAETVEGGLKVTFAPGQRQEVLHVSFCPPLAGVPEVECEVLDDVPVQVRVTAAQPYGLRIEARRDDVREALTTEISFAATALPAKATAA